MQVRRPVLACGKFAEEILFGAVRTEKERKDETIV